MTGFAPLLALLPVAHAGLKDAELEALLVEVVPLVERVAGRRFTTPPAVNARPPGRIDDIIDSEDQALAPHFYPSLGPLALGAFQRGGRPAGRVFSRFGLQDQTVHVRADLRKAWTMQRRALGLEALPSETEADLAACVLAHALHSQHADLDRVVQSGDMERLAAWNTLAEGHAVLVERAVCAARGTPELSQRLDILRSFDGPGPGPGAGELQPSIEAGLRFIEAQDDVWAAFAEPPSDTRMVYRPDLHTPGVPVAPFPAWPALASAAVAMVDGRPTLQMRDRAGFQTLLPLVRRAESGERALDPMRAAHIQTIAQGGGVVELMAVEMDSPAAARGLLQALREQEAWRLRPERRWRAATFAEPPADSTGPAGGWQSRFTVRPSTAGELGAVTEVRAATRGRWVVRCWLHQLSPGDATAAAALDGALTALVAAAP